MRERALKCAYASIPLHFVQSLSVSCDALCWELTVLGLIRTHENRRSFRNRNRRLRSGSRPSHLNVVLSKAALSGPSVCLRARAPCPLCVSCLRIARERTGLAFPAGADHRIASSLQRSFRLWRAGGSLGQDSSNVRIEFSRVLLWTKNNKKN